MLRKTVPALVMATGLIFAGVGNADADATHDDVETQVLTISRDGVTDAEIAELLVLVDRVVALPRDEITPSWQQCFLAELKVVAVAWVNGEITKEEAGVKIAEAALYCVGK